MWKDSDPRDADSRDEALWDARERVDDSRARDSLDPRDVFREGLNLPRGRDRERVFLGDEALELRGSEVRTLATIGAFRVVPVDELLDDRGRSGDLWHGDLDRLANAVARHKSMFFAEKAADRTPIDYATAVNGGLQLVPAGDGAKALEDDYARMVEDGLLFDDAEPFEALMARCADIAARANNAAK